MSKNAQQIRSHYQLGYRDGTVGDWGKYGRYTHRSRRARWAYRWGFKTAMRHKKYGKGQKKPFVLSRGATIALDLIVGFILIMLVGYVAGLIGGK